MPIVSGGTERHPHASARTSPAGTEITSMGTTDRPDVPFTYQALVMRDPDASTADVLRSWWGDDCDLSYFQEPDREKASAFARTSRQSIIG